MSDKFDKAMEDLRIFIEDAEGDAFILGKQEDRGAAQAALTERAYIQGKKEGHDIGHKQGRIDQAAVEQSSREGSASTAKAAFARGYKKGHKHGKSQGYQLGTQDIISASKTSYKEGRGSGYAKGKIDGKAIAGVVLRKAYLEGRYEGFSKGISMGYKERSAGQAAEPKPKSEPVFARAYGEPWSPEDQAEPEHATSQEADHGLNEPASFADLIGYLTEERRAKHRGV